MKPMKLWKLIMAGVIALGLAGAIETMPTIAEASDNISIDGDFSDWKTADLTEGYNGFTALESHGQYLDVYIQKKDGGIPENGNYDLVIADKHYYLKPQNLTASVNAGEKKAFSLVAGTWNGGDQYGTVATGYVGNVASHNVAEFRIDLTKLNLTKAVNGKVAAISNSDIGNNPSQMAIDWTDSGQDGSSVAASGGAINGKADQSSKGTTPTDSNAANDNDNLNIKIDGKFADWKNVTLTEGYNGYTAMVSDGNDVYVYVKMKYGLVPGYGNYNFDIGGKRYNVWSDDMPESSVKAGESQAVNFIGGTYTDGHQYGTVGDGYVSSDKDGHNIAEFKVDLRKFHLSTMTGQTITMYNPNIGNEKVTVAGGSTGPYVISGIGLAIAGLGYWRLKKSGKLNRKTKK